MGPIERLKANSILDDSPPHLRTRIDNHATLLVSWWCTGCALVLILLRLWGRYVRTERLFREDKIMALSIIPLLIRMALVDPLMLYGTNNTTTLGLSDLAIHERVVGSKLVLPSRIFYAMFIWIAKFTVSEYLKRLTEAVWTTVHERVLHFIRIFLLVTFLAVVIATLSECQPFTHYWQVVPDPGPRCRNGYAQLLVMGTCDIITDILLIAFPLSIVARSRMPFGRKISIGSLFALSFLLIAVTAYRMPAIIEARGRQQLRTLWASLEILAAAAVSNAVILGSFLRDRGVKKQKYKCPDDTQRSYSSNEPQTNFNKTMTRQHWGNDSDEDLFAALRGRLDSVNVHEPGPALAAPAEISHLDPYRDQELREMGRTGSISSMTGRPRMSYPPPGQSAGQPQLLDVGGILSSSPLRGNPLAISSNPLERHPPLVPQSAAHVPSTSAFDFADVGGLLSRKEVHPNPTPDIQLSPLQPAKRRDIFLSPYSPSRPHKRSDPANPRQSTDSRMSVSPSSLRPRAATTSGRLGVSSARHTSRRSKDLPPLPGSRSQSRNRSPSISVTDTDSASSAVVAGTVKYLRALSRSRSRPRAATTASTLTRTRTEPSNYPPTPPPIDTSSMLFSEPSQASTTASPTHTDHTNAEPGAEYNSKDAARLLLAKIREVTDVRRRPDPAPATSSHVSKQIEQRVSDWARIDGVRGVEDKSSERPDTRRQDEMWELQEVEAERDRHHHKSDPLLFGNGVG